MILDDVMADVSSQLDQQAELSVQITACNEVPEVGPTNRGVWFQIPQVAAVFADLKSSTELSATESPRVAALAYTYFIRAMAVTFDRFSAKYVDIQGDGIFGLFSGKGSRFLSTACAITMRTLMKRDVSVRFKKDACVDWELTAGVGIDIGTLLVRRLGLRGTSQNEVWAGKPVNMAAKLSSVASRNELVVSDRVFSWYERFSRLRRRVLLWTCGCENGVVRRGLDMAIGSTTYLWQEEPAPQGLGLDFDNIHRLRSLWCKTHGPEFCQTLVEGRRPGQ